MFALDLARKYLIPRRRQLSASLIALLSVVVISLVVWLVILFISVTGGIEKTWLKKLTSLHAPLRIHPTEAYFSSYYHQIDTVSMASDYRAKSLEEKRRATLTNPYDENVDAAVPAHWPAPVTHDDGKPKDLVKELFSAIDEIDDPTLVANCYEVSGALLRLKLLRPGRHRGEMETQSFLTQMAYVASFTDKGPYMKELLCSPTSDDIDHLLYLQSRSGNAPLVDSYAPTKSAEKVSLPGGIDVTRVAPKGPFFKPPFALFADGARLPAHIERSAAGISHIELREGGEHVIEKRGDGWIIDSGDRVASTVPLFTAPYVEMSAARAEGGAAVRGKLFGQAIAGILPWKELSVRAVKAAPLPLESAEATPVYLPKNFRDSGVRIGDKGYLAYGASSSGAASEQRLPIDVVGFYDPGVLSVGARCLLMPEGAVRDLRAANNSYAMDPEMTSGVQVWHKDLSETEAHAKTLRAALKKRGLDPYFRVTSYKEYSFAKDLLQQFQSDKTLFTLVGLIVLTVACSNIISFLVLLVNDKKREIGILMAMGASRRSVAAIFASCGVVVGALGGLIGTAAAYFTLHNIDSLIWLLSKIQGHDLFNAVFYGSSLKSEMSTTALLFVLITTPLMSLLAGIIPAMKASRLEPTALLRSEL